MRRRGAGGSALFSLASSWVWSLRPLLGLKDTPTRVQARRPTFSPREQSISKTSDGERKFSHGHGRDLMEEFCLRDIIGSLKMLRRTYSWSLGVALCGLVTVAAQAAGGAPNPPCRIESTMYQGWQAQRLSNRWVTLSVVPQNGGRLMQVIFGGHAYLFVNPKYAGKYLPPTQ